MNHSLVWQCLSVREFISVCNWENRSLAPISNSGDRISKSLTSWRCLTAGDFFAFNNWSGQAVYAESEQLIATPVAFSLTLPTNRLWQCFNWTGKPNSSLEAISKVDEARKAKRGGLGRGFQGLEMNSSHSPLAFPHEPSLQEDVAGVPPVVLKDTPSDKSIEQEVIEQAESAIAAVEEFTLNDLSQLF